MIKIAFFDIDGTLYSHTTNTVPDSAHRAFEAMGQKGILRVMCTGRFDEEIKDFAPLQALDFDARVLLNGQLCDNPEGVIYARPFPQDDLDVFLQGLEQRPFACLFLTNEGMFVNYIDDHVRAVQEAIHTPLPPVGDMSRIRTLEVYQICPYTDVTYDDWMNRLPGVEATRWGPDAVDLIPQGGGKGRGIEQVLVYYGLDKSEAIGFGDAENDLSMFDAVGTSVAMGNALETVKAAADYVTDDIDEDGVWNALVRLGVIG